jgi:hypothetical protein
MLPGVCGYRSGLAVIPAVSFLLQLDLKIMISTNYLDQPCLPRVFPFPFVFAPYWCNFVNNLKRAGKSKRTA